MDTAAVSSSEQARQLLHYWYTTLTDRSLSTGVFSRKDAAQHLGKIPYSDVLDGQLSEEAVAFYFKDEADDCLQVTVEIRPFVYNSRRTGKKPPLASHGVITPIVATAELARDGHLTPGGKVAIPRALLAPLDDDRLTIGNLDDLYRFVIDQDPLPGWPGYLAYWNALLESVCGGSNIAPDQYQMSDRSGICIAESDDMTAKIEGLYSHLLHSTGDVPALVRTLATTSEQTPSISPQAAGTFFGRRSSHSSRDYGLSPTQRTALAEAVTAEHGDIVAVNGPPGTGKTTLLLSVVASYWVNAALAGSDPPLIVAASTNNQAVTNVIDAFGKNYGTGDGALAGRWLPTVNSYGSYFPAFSKMEEAKKHFQTQAFFDEIEDDNYLASAHQMYLDRGRVAYPNLRVSSIESIVAALHRDLHRVVAELQAVGQAWDRTVAARHMLEHHVAQALSTSELSLTRETYQAALDCDWPRVTQELETQEKSESIWLSIFGWLPQVKGRQTRASSSTARLHWPSKLPMPNWASREEVLADVRSWTELRAAVETSRQELSRLTEPLSGGVTPTDQDELESVCDRTLRFQSFVLATHYWEGRWLLAMNEIPWSLEDEKNKRGRGPVLSRWKRRMMLTPCAVSTLHSLPGQLTARRLEGGKFVDDYLDEAIDLLIIDEAGQVSPEIGGAAFGLAKRALVIGDTKQIEPISNTVGSVDKVNLFSAGLASDAGDFVKLCDRGLTASSGSLMRHAQNSCKHHQEPDLDRGLYLFEHRRCRDEIIGYCNSLCYKGRLQPLRQVDTDKPAPPVPVLGYGHVDGICTTAGTSRVNLVEAVTVAEWIVSQKGALEAHYDLPVSKIVAVVTPFSAHAEEIGRVLQESGINCGKGGLTVGTVHSLQGAERPVVLFSQVYSKHADGPFIDAGPNMLNVAVSRAQDSFLFVGDLDAAAAAGPSSPRRKLWSWLRNNGGQELALPPPAVRRDLAPSPSDVDHLKDFEEHDRFLIDTLDRAKNEVHIVSPWFRRMAISESHALPAMNKAVARGVTVRVYTDPVSNVSSGSRDERAERSRQLDHDLSILSQRGIETVKVRHVHSKVVIGDRDVYCLGSFNWFSARRDNSARLEASLVYRGDRLVDEIATLLTDLDARRVV